MTKYFSIICLFLVPTFLFAQKQFGLYVQGVSGSIWVQNPERPEDGTFAYNRKEGFGGGITWDNPLNNRLSLSFRIGYSQKGFVGATKRSESGAASPLGSVTMHYVGMDQLLKFWVKPEKVYLMAGTRNERMVANNLPSEFENPQSGSLISTNDFHRWNFGGLTGIGYDYDGSLYFEGGMNFDIAPTMRTATALLRNYVWYANIGYRLF